MKLKIILIIFSISVPFLSHVTKYLEKTNLIKLSENNWIIIFSLLSIFAIILFKNIPKEQKYFNSKLFFYFALIFLFYLNFPNDGLRFRRLNLTFVITHLFITPVLCELSFRVSPIYLFPKQLGKSAFIIFIIFLNSLYTIYHFAFPYLNAFSPRGLELFLFGISMTTILITLKSPCYPIIFHSACNLISFYHR